MNVYKSAGKQIFIIRKVISVYLRIGTFYNEKNVNCRKTKKKKKNFKKNFGLIY